MIITFFAGDKGARGFEPPRFRPDNFKFVDAFSAEGFGTVCLILLTALLGAADAAFASSGAFFEASVFTLSARSNS